MTLAYPLQITRARDISLTMIDRLNEAVSLQTAPLVAQLTEQAELIGGLNAENAMLQAGNRELREQLQELESTDAATPWWKFWNR